MDKKILQHYVEGLTSKEETEAVVNWLDENEEHVRELIAMHKLHNLSLFNKPAATGDAHDRYSRDKKHTRKNFKKISVELLKIAAAFLIFVAVSQLIADKPGKRDMVAYQTLFIPAGQRAELTLSDSTKVWLNARTRLVYPVSFGNEESCRTITLDGEAYFEVKRNEKQPFIIKTKTMDIHVLGTELNVMAYSGMNMAEVALLKGAADINAADGTTRHTQKHSMKINEQVTFRDGRFNTTTINDFDYFKWKEGLLCFNNETVASIIEKLQLYFDVKINVHQAELLTYRYTGKFRTKDGVEQVLKVLQLEHFFTYTRDNELNLITIQ